MGVYISTGLIIGIREVKGRFTILNGERQRTVTGTPMVLPSSSVCTSAYHVPSPHFLISFRTADSVRSTMGFNTGIDIFFAVSVEQFDHSFLRNSRAAHKKRTFRVASFWVNDYSQNQFSDIFSPYPPFHHLDQRNIEPFCNMVDRQKMGSGAGTTRIQRHAFPCRSRTPVPFYKYGADKNPVRQMNSTFTRRIRQKHIAGIDLAFKLLFG